MANSIGNLAYKLSIDPTNWTSGLDRALKDVDRFSGRLKSKLAGSGLGLGGLMGAIPSVSAGGAMAWIEKSRNDLINLSKEAERYGFSMRDAATFELLAADHAEEMNKALDHLSRGIGEIRSGGGADFQKALQGLGLSGQDLAGKNTAQAYELISDRISKLGNEHDKAYYRSEIFKKGSESLANVINRGAAGFEAAAEKVDQYGLAISDADAAQMRMQAKQMKENELKLKGLGRQAAASPAVGFVTDTVGVALGALNDAFALRGKSWLKTPLKEWEVIKKAWRGGGAEGQQAGQGEDNGQPGLQIATAATDQIENQMRAMTHGAAEARVYATELQLVAAGLKPDEIEKAIKPVEDLANAHEELSNILHTSAHGLDIFQDATRKINEVEAIGFAGKISPEIEMNAIGKINSDLEKAKKALQFQTMEDAKSPAEKFRDQMNTITETFKGVAGGAEIVTKRIGQLKMGLAETLGVADPMEGLLKKFGELDQYAGFGGISRQQALAAKGRAGMDVINQAGLGEVQLPQFMTLGSQEFASLQARMEAQNAGGSWQDRLISAIEALKGIAERDAEEGRAFEQAMLRQKPVVIHQANIYD